MFEDLFIDRGTIAHYRCEPLLEERLSYLRHCAQEGARPHTLRTIAAAQITLIRLLDLRTGERVSVPRIEAAADRRSSRSAQPKVRGSSSAAQCDGYASWICSMSPVGCGKARPRRGGHGLQGVDAQRARMVRGDDPQLLPYD